MIKKHDYHGKLIKLTEIFKKYDFLNSSVGELEVLEQTIDDFAFRVVLIGGFSSGKSALLNRLVGRHIFKEDQLAETSVPAEVSWAPVEDAHAIYADGSRKELNLETATSNPPADAYYLTIHIDHPFFKQRPELILVDFPGFDSNVEAHNKAINAYLKKGSAFILLVPAQNGSLGASDIKFLKEATYYPQNLACFISKSDVRPASKCEEIVQFVRKGIEDVYIGDTLVTAISSREGKQEEFEKIVGDTLDRFNPQELFDLSFAPAINEQINKGITALEQYMAASALDVRDIDKRLGEAVEIQENLNRQLAKERRSLDQKYQYEIIPGILNRVEKALRGNIANLADAAIAGEQRFADAAQSIIRPILANVPGEIQANLREVIGSMHIDQPGQTSAENDSLKESLLNIVDVLSTMIPTAKGNAPAKSDMGGKGQQSSNMFSGLNSGIIVGALVNPILGVVIGLAPALIEIFFGRKRNEPRQDSTAQARAQIESQTIPSIISKLENQVKPAVLETRDMMFEEIQKKIGESLSANTEAMEQAKREKEERQEKHSNEIASMQADVDILKSMFIENRCGA